MANLGEGLSILGVLAATLLALAWLSTQVSFAIQLLVLTLTRNEKLPPLILFLVLLPGILLHESAHWVAARLLGLKTGKFRVWPKVKGNRIGLGSVTVQRGALWQDSLVGLAPLLAGSAVIAWIGYQIFAVDRLTMIVTSGQWIEGLIAFWRALGTADGALWAYLLFAVANAMMPSSSDREPLKPLLLYLAVIALAYLLVGLPVDPLTTGLVWLTPLLELVTSALIFVLLLDGIIVLVLWLVRTLFEGESTLQPRPRSRRR